MAFAANIATLLGMLGIAATGVWLFMLLKPVASARAIALDMLYPTAQLLFVAFFRWCLALSRTTPDIAMLVPLPVCCAVCIIGNVLMFPNLPLNERSRQFELEAERLHAATEASLRDLRERRADIDRASQWRSGVDDQIVALRRALVDRDLPAAEHATDLIADAAGRGRARLCDHPAANALLMVECTRMRELGITVDCAAEIPRGIGIDGASLCAVIGNLLDNAINACAPRMSDSGETDNHGPEPTPRVTDSGESDNRGANSNPRMTDSGESDNHDTNLNPRMTDSGESDIETPWVRIRIDAGHANGNKGRDGNGSLTIRVSNAYARNVNHDSNEGRAHGLARPARRHRHRHDARPGFGDHGWGMRIVTEIARRQNGTFTYGIGEDAQHGPCWYAIATLADRTASTPALPPSSPSSIPTPAHQPRRNAPTTKARP